MDAPFCVYATHQHCLGRKTCGKGHAADGDRHQAGIGGLRPKGTGAAQGSTVPAKPEGQDRLGGQPRRNARAAFIAVVLVDTSAWVDFFAERATRATRQLEILIGDDAGVFSTGLIVQELLSGVKNPKQRKLLRSEMDKCAFIMPTLETHVEAAGIYDTCRKRGKTIRSPIDCLIAALAMEYELAVLSGDRDFRTIAEVLPLRLA